MSFSLWLISEKNNIDDMSAAYQLSEKEAAAYLIEDHRLIDAGNEILKVFPALESLEEDVIDESPWSSSPEITIYWIHLAIRFSQVDMIFQKLGPIFEKYRLLGYDPQSGKIYG